jgi:hypothetical protein
MQKSRKSGGSPGLMAEKGGKTGRKAPETALFPQFSGVLSGAAWLEQHNPHSAET